jgi:hypothetical protein
MSEHLKNARVELMMQSLMNLHSLKKFYVPGSPAWTLLPRRPYKGIFDDDWSC